MKTLIAILLLCACGVSVQAQALVVKAEVVATGVLPPYEWQSARPKKLPDAVKLPAIVRVGWLVRANVINQSLEPVTVAYMNCSWDESWELSKTDDFQWEGWGCVGNFPTETVLRPGEVLAFEFVVLAARQEVITTGGKLRFGFHWQKLVPDPKWFHRLVDQATIWSDEIVLPKIVDQVLPGEGKIMKSAANSVAPADSAQK